MLVRTHTQKVEGACVRCIGAALEMSFSDDRGHLACSLDTILSS